MKGGIGEILVEILNSNVIFSPKLLKIQPSVIKTPNLLVLDLHLRASSTSSISRTLITETTRGTFQIPSSVTHMTRQTDNHSKTVISVAVGEKERVTNR